MARLLEWLGVTPVVRDVWCVRCKARRTVRKVKIHEDGRPGSRRLVGKCQTCESATSTFVK